MQVSQSTMKKTARIAWRSSGREVRGAARAEVEEAVASRRRARVASSCSSSTGVKFTVQRTRGWRSSIHAMSLYARVAWSRTHGSRNSPLSGSR